MHMLLHIQTLVLGSVHTPRVDPARTAPWGAPGGGDGERVKGRHLGGEDGFTFRPSLTSRLSVRALEAPTLDLNPLEQVT